jgi:ABC-type sugar transport system ATPase subunit
VAEPLLEARSVAKRYGHVQALDGASFAVCPGEVVALIGDNGAGKSTLVKVLSGAIRPDGGELLVEGKAVSFASPVAARRHGIETVYQDLALAPTSTRPRTFTWAGRSTWSPKLELVADLGAAYHHGEMTGLGFRPDVVVECTGTGRMVVELAGRAARAAVICLVGISSARSSLPVTVDRVNAQVVLGNTVIFGTVSSARRHYQQSLDALVKADPQWLARLISRRVPLSSWSDALAKGPDEVKVVVDLRE